MPTDMPATRTGRLAKPKDDLPLRRDVRMLGFELSHVLRRHASPGLNDLVERIRRLAEQRRAEVPGAEAGLRQEIATLGDDQLGELIRALACFFDLSNLAEDRHRMRVLRHRERAMNPTPQPESVVAAIAILHRQGLNAHAMQAMIDRLDIELVFTAHPTEAKRRTIRNTLNRLRDDLVGLDGTDLLPRERKAVLSRMRADLDCLWETDTLRPCKPTVAEEVQRNLFVMESIWRIVPRLYRTMREALAQAYPGHNFRVPAFLHFGTWIGGDRDGNPFVTTAVTRETLEILRRNALAKHVQQCHALSRVLSVSERQHPIRPELNHAIADAIRRWPEMHAVIERINPNEKYRRWLRIIEYRIEQTAGADPLEPLPDAAYAAPAELLRDLQLIADSLRANDFHRLADGLLQDWLDRVATFGFHLARLDIREDAGKLNAAVGELLTHLGTDAVAYDSLDESARQVLLSQPIDRSAARQLNRDQLTAATRETIELFILLHHSRKTFGPGALGAVIASMTHRPSDVMAMLWLGRLATTICDPSLGTEAPHGLHLPVVPLFETIEDLKRSAGVLDELLSYEPYAEYLRATGNRQMCMIGYSDSTKDGGFLAANWRIHEAQRHLTEVAKRHRVEVVFFHGRGGSLGRGGGPAARGILALPPDSVDGRLRVTEQGEVLAERYDDPEIANRHLEQVTWATMLVSAKASERIPDAWLHAMDRASDAAERAYRALMDDPGFIEYFQHATPIEIIESMPIGSRPSRRQKHRDLSNLRAIPYTFAWTQNRHGLTAYFGLGSGLAEAANGDWSDFQEMYQHWPLFRSMLDNAELGLAKANVDIARCYAELVPDATVGQRIWQIVAEEFGRSCAAVMCITGRSEMLETTPWLQQSIRVRNPYVDPLNFIQIELLRRLQQARAEQAPVHHLEQFHELLRLSVQGIAAGLRTTG